MDLSAFARLVIDEIRAQAPIIAPEYLTVEQAAQLTGFSKRALESMRARREGPKWIKCGRVVRYPIADLRAWMSQGTIS